MITSDSVINSLGGYKAVAAALSLDPSTVIGWRIRGIPSSRWLPLVRLASEQGVPEITLEALAQLKTPATAEDRP